MAHASTHHSSGGAGSFLFGILFTLAIIGAALIWMGQQSPAAHVSELRPTLSIPMPKIQPPPGVIPRAEHPL